MISDYIHLGNKKMFTKLLGLQYKVIYKKGSKNGIADALSRKLVHEASCAAVSTVSPQWLLEIQSGYQSDEHALSLITKPSVDSKSVPGYSLVNGLLKYKNRIWVGNNVKLQLQLLHTCHASAIGGHSRIPVTYLRLKQMFA
jgi:hypothetical protein